MLTDYLEEKPADLPPEGMGTLAAQLTLKSVNTFLEKIEQARSRGVDERELVQALQRELADYDLHTQRRLLQFADGVVIPDDFGPEAVRETVHVKPNTMQVSFNTVPEFLGQYTLVRYLGKDWLTTASDGDTFTFKALD